MRYTLPTATLLLLALVLGTHAVYRRDMAVARQRIMSGSHIASTRYGEIEYADHGQGTPVLLIHGAGGGYDQGLLLGRIALDDAFRLISVSRFGYLRSPIPDDASVTSQAALFAALLDHLGIDKVIVIAGSAGGPSALQFAHDFPERTSALVLISAVSKVMPPGEQNAGQISVIQTIQRSDFLFWLVSQVFQSQFLALLGVPPDVYAQLSLEEQALAHEMLDVMHPMSLRRAGSFREGEQTPLDATDLQLIVAPTLILHAKDDSLVVAEHAEHAHRGIRQSRLVLYDTGGHGLLARIDGVRANVRDFLNSVLIAQ